MGKILYIHKKNEGIKMSGKITEKELAYRFLCFAPMTHKKLQKLCYYAQAWYIALHNGEKLIDNDFEAWVHGPVCPELYDEFKSYGGMKIFPRRIPIISKDIEAHIVKIYEIYGQLDGNELEELTHQEEPWLRARKNIGSWNPSRNIISTEVMESFYRRLLNE